MNSISNAKAIGMLAVMVAVFSLVAVKGAVQADESAQEGAVYGEDTSTGTFPLYGSFTIGEEYDHVPVAFGTSYSGSFPGLTLATETIEGFNVITATGSPTRSHTTNIAVGASDGKTAYVELRSHLPGGAYAYYDVIKFTFKPGVYYDRMFSTYDTPSAADAVPGMTFYTKEIDDPKYPVVMWIKGTPTSDTGSTYHHAKNFQTTIVCTREPVLSVSIAQPEKTEIGIGETIQLSATVNPSGNGVAYLSYNPSIASSNQVTGEIKGLSAGIATISVCAHDDTQVSDTIKISVGNFYSYEIKYDQQGGTSWIWPHTETSQSNTLSYKISDSTPERDGYTFKGWGSYQGSTTVTYQPGGTYTFQPGTTTLYAIWNEKFDLTPTVGDGYADFDASTAVNFSVVAGTSLCTTQKISDTKFRVTPISAGTITVKAVSKTDSGAYVQRSIYVSSVTYDANGGIGVPDKELFIQTSTSSHTFALSTDYPSRDDTVADDVVTTYTCLGWNTANNADSVIRTVDVGYNSNKTVYAIWESNNTYAYTIAYDLNGGTGTKESTIATDAAQTKSIQISSEIPTREGFTFAGWSKNADGTGDVYEAGGTYVFDYGTTQLYAKWADGLVITSDPVADGKITRDSETNEFTFDASMSRNAVSILWDFGDGATSTDMVAKHTYEKNGTYDVKLTVVSQDGKYSVWNEKVEVGDTATETLIQDGGIDLKYVVAGVIVAIVAILLIARFI